MSVLATHLSGQFTFRGECGPCTIYAKDAPHVGRAGREDGHGSCFRKRGAVQASAHRRRSFPDIEAFDLGRPRASLSRPTWCEPAIVVFHEDLPPVLVREGEGDPCFCGRSMVHHIEQQFPHGLKPQHCLVFGMRRLVGVFLHGYREPVTLPLDSTRAGDRRIRPGLNARH